MITVKFIYRSCILLVSLVPISVPAQEQTPELSADEPIAYNDSTGLLVATGNARYVDENTTVEADEIRYNRETERIEASGNVRVTRTGLRLLAEQLTYNATDKTFAAKDFRAGYPPLFIEGESFQGNLEAVDFNNVSLYFREPVSDSPRIFIKEGQWVADEYVKGRGLSLKTFGDFGVPLPGMTYAFGQQAIDVDASVGYEGNLGAYAQSYFLYPFSKSLAAGGNLDLYTKRGVLIGPAFRWTDTEKQTQAYLNTGWIHDQSSKERGVDVLGDAIEQDRGFVEFEYATKSKDAGLQFKARGTYLTDSEVLRDFREDMYFQSFHPDNFADFTWQEGDFLLNVFARAQLNEYYTMVERLPEVRAEWLPNELADTGIFVQATAAATRYRLQEIDPSAQSIVFPDNPLGLPGFPLKTGALPAELKNSAFYNRLDSAVTLTRPFHAQKGIDLVFRAGGRWSAYNRESFEGTPSANDERLVGELGLDLSQTLARTYAVDLPKWGIDKIRHQSRTFLKYRWHPGAEEASEITPPFDLFAYRPAPPSLDLADITHIDGMRELSVVRLGWENSILVAGENGPYREYLSLAFHQDVNFSNDLGEDLWDALYIDMDFQPISWFRLQWSQKIRPEDGETEATYVRTAISSSDLWTLGAQAEYLRYGINQYIFDAQYRVSQNFGLIGNWHYDALLSEWTHQKYGIVRRFGNVWQMDLYVTFNERNGREDDFGVGLRLRWLNF